METKGFYDRYKSVYYQFGAEKTVMLAFCELFTAHCLEVKKSDTSGDLTHLYRFKGSATTSVLHKVETIVAEQFADFRAFPEMMEGAKRSVKKYYKIGPANIMERLLGKGRNDPLDGNPQFKQILAEALQRNAITYAIEPGHC
jgi:hypothetical protein